MHNLNGTYVLDPAHSVIGFIARHAMVTKVRGNFGEFDATFTINDEDFQASATIKSASITTGMLIVMHTFAEMISSPPRLSLSSPLLLPMQ